MVWILTEAGLSFSPHFPDTLFVWIKLHKNGVVYCPYEAPKGHVEDETKSEGHSQRNSSALRTEHLDLVSASHAIMIVIRPIFQMCLIVCLTR
jgi:hypothetical protein